MPSKRKIIGRITEYTGEEHPSIHGCKVKILYFITPGDEAIIKNDEYLEKRGFKPNDRFDVQPWIKTLGRFSFISYDAKAKDLACLKKRFEKKTTPKKRRGK